MDRTIVYPGSIPLDTDLLTTNRNTMVAIGALAAATIGTAPVVDGLGVVPAASGGLAVQVLPGSISSYQAVDQSAYGSLPPDISDSTMKTGISTAPVTVALSAPTTIGYGVTYLIQAALQEADANPAVLPYYNAANPAQPFLGPNNSGAAQPTVRLQRPAVQAKAGTPAPLGSNLTPAPDPGFLGLATVTIQTGQTSVTSANIAQYPATRFIGLKLPDLRPGFGAAQVYTSSGWFYVPPGVTALKVTVVGGGGAAGTHTVFPGGGGGAGGWTVGWFTGIVPGTAIYATVGGGGIASGAAGNGAPGGSSGFGTFIAATGGQGGGGGSVLVPPAGGAGGQGYGGQVVGEGTWGTDGIPIASLGGQGGGPGGGKGSTGVAPGVWGGAPGAGGGGGGSSLPNGGGTGSPGGNGVPGIIIVEY